MTFLQIQGRKPTAGIMNAARGDMSEGFPRIAGFEYVNPRGAASLGGLQNSGSLGGFQNYMRSPDYTSLARDSPASTYGAYSTFQSGGILDQKSSIVPQDKTSVKQPPTQVVCLGQIYENSDLEVVLECYAAPVESDRCSAATQQFTVA